VAHADRPAGLAPNISHRGRRARSSRRLLGTKSIVGRGRDWRASAAGCCQQNELTALSPSAPAEGGERNPAERNSLAALAHRNHHHARNNSRAEPARKSALWPSLAQAIIMLIEWPFSGPDERRQSGTHTGSNVSTFCLLLFWLLLPPLLLNCC
jgi:hypothetical protein